MSQYRLVVRFDGRDNNRRFRTICGDRDARKIARVTVKNMEERRGKKRDWWSLYKLHGNEIKPVYLDWMTPDENFKSSVGAC